MWNCNIFSTTYPNMLLNFTQCNVSAKYNLAILQFNVSDKHLACYDSVDSMYTNICLASNPFKMPAEYMRCLSVTEVNMSAKVLLAIADFHVSATYLSGNEKL